MARRRTRPRKAAKKPVTPDDAPAPKPEPEPVPLPAAPPLVPISARVQGVLTVLPLLYLALLAVVAHLHGPFYLTENIDPEYHYLFNATKLADFAMPSTFQHPGVPVVLISAIVISVGWFFSGLFGGWTPKIVSVAQHHSGYLAAIAWLQALAIVALGFMAGRRIYRLTGSVWPALAAQLSLFLVFVAVEHSYRVSPEPMQIVAGLALLYVLAPVTLGLESRAGADPRRAVWVGFWLAVGIATKYNFVVATLLVLVLPGLRQKVRAALSCIGMLLALLIPVFAQPGSFVGFVRIKLTQAGSETRALAEWPSQFTRALQEVPLVTWSVILLLATAALTAGSLRRSGTRFCRAHSVLWIGAAILAAHLALTSMRVRHHYFVTALAIVYLIAPHLVQVLREARISRAARIALFGAAALLAGMSLWQARRDFGWYASIRRGMKADAAALAAKRAEMSECRVVSYYRSSVPTDGLGFGNNFSQEFYKDELERLYPGALRFSPFRMTFSSWDRRARRTELEEFIEQGGCVLMQGNNISGTTVAGMQMRPVLLPRGWDSYEGLFELSLDSANPELVSDPSPISRSLVIEAEDFVEGTVTTRQAGPLTLITAPQAGAMAAYSFTGRPRRYAIRIQYASDDSRPVRVKLNGELISDHACLKPTGGAKTTDRKWHDIGTFQLLEGDNTIRLESDGPFPLIDRIALRTVE